MTYLGMERAGPRCYHYRGFEIQWHIGPRAWYVRKIPGEAMTYALDAVDNLRSAQAMVDYWADGGMGAGRLEIRGTGC